MISEIGLGSDGIAALILGSRTGSRTLYGASPRNTSQIKRLQNRFDILKGCKKSRRAKKERARALRAAIPSKLTFEDAMRMQRSEEKSARRKEKSARRQQARRQQEWQPHKLRQAEATAAAAEVAAAPATAAAAEVAEATAAAAEVGATAAAAEVAAAPATAAAVEVAATAAAAEVGAAPATATAAEVAEATGAAAEVAAAPATAAAAEVAATTAAAEVGAAPPVSIEFEWTFLDLFLNMIAVATPYSGRYKCLGSRPCKFGCINIIDAFMNLIKIALWIPFLGGCVIVLVSLAVFFISTMGVVSLFHMMRSNPLWWFSKAACMAVKVCCALYATTGMDIMVPQSTALAAVFFVGLTEGIGLGRFTLWLT